MLGKFQRRSILLWIMLEQGPTVFAVGAGGGCLNTFLSLLSLGNGLIYTEILSRRAVKPKTTN